MATEEEARWAQMTGSGSAPSGMMAPPPAPAAPPPPMATMEASGKKGKKEKATKAHKPTRTRNSGAYTSDKDWVVTFDEGPSRQEMEQQAAAELFSALSVSYDLLHAHVPDAASPEDAMR